ncbi:hypothetical protein [Bradyrhizobium sp. WSM2254]|uniref:hypothetical protein n=1 Tax=Bradyrhizobium sp. WSM2254 TaxID=1188263 RepID=UPI00067655CB|nr:hypothetical protein [Bradyrhizobium sp. WSM2254]
MGRHKSKNKGRDTMSVVHPSAAAIIGTTMHMAAVNADRTPEPIRSFGTFRTDLHWLVVNRPFNCGLMSTFFLKPFGNEVALGPLERVGVAETGRARLVDR